MSYEDPRTGKRCQSRPPFSSRRRTQLAGSRLSQRRHSRAPGSPSNYAPREAGSFRDHPKGAAPDRGRVQGSGSPPLNICAWVESGDRSANSATADEHHPSFAHPGLGDLDRPEVGRAAPVRVHRTGMCEQSDWQAVVSRPSQKGPPSVVATVGAVRSSLVSGDGGGEDMPENDAFEPGYTGNENEDLTQLHRPYVRHVHTDWRRDNYGRWVSETWDESKWEVICAECGDNEGPSEVQGPAIQQFRGPYPTEHKAVHAAHAHERKSNPRLRWLPGSTVPQRGGQL